MSEELTREALLQQIADQAAQIAALIKQLNTALEANNTLHKRIQKLEKQVKRYVAPHSREQPKADPKPPGRKAGQGTFSFKHAPAHDTVTRIIEVEPANTCPSCQRPREFLSAAAWLRGHGDRKDGSPRLDALQTVQVPL